VAAAFLEPFQLGCRAEKVATKPRDEGDRVAPAVDADLIQIKGKAIAEAIGELNRVQISAGGAADQLLGSISTPGLSMPCGSSSDLAARSAAANSGGR